MIEFEVSVVNRAGLHTRPAATLVKLTSKYKSNIFIEKDGMRINGKSIIGVMTLAAEMGSTLSFEIDGSDESEMADEIRELFMSGFGEPV
jgi:phosphocarrier protein